MKESCDNCKKGTEVSDEPTDESSVKDDGLGANFDQNKPLTNGRSDSGKLSIALMAAFVVCCGLPLIILSVGAGISSYFFLHESSVILFFAILLLVLLGIAVALYFHNIRSRTETRSKENRAKDAKVTDTGKCKSFCKGGHSLKWRGIVMQKKCDLCDREFSTDQGLIQHYSDKHPETNPPSEALKREAMRQKNTASSPFANRRRNKLLVVAALVIVLVAIASVGVYIGTRSASSNTTDIGKTS